MSPFFSFLAMVSFALASLSPGTSAAKAVAGNGSSSTARAATTVNYRQEFLQAHNKARAAAGVPPLAWNSTLQLDSMRYTNELRLRCSTIPLYAWGTDGMYGRNLFKGKDVRTAAVAAVASWVGEERWYDRSSNTCAAPEGRSCGEYTQVVWRATTQVGCARRFCRGSSDAAVAVCEYYPPGNVKGQRP